MGAHPQQDPQISVRQLVGPGPPHTEGRRRRELHAEVHALRGRERWAGIKPWLPPMWVNANAIPGLCLFPLQYGGGCGGG